MATETELAIARNLFEAACAKALSEGLSLTNLREIVDTTLLLENENA